MTRKVAPVVLDGGLGKRWWEHPDFLWLGRDAVRERRLYVTLSRVVLPLLQDLESLQRQHYPDAPMLLRGKSLEQVENDPVALEFALFLYELALERDLILTRTDKKGALVSVRKRLAGAVGSCCLTPNEVAQRYVRQLAGPILAKGGHSAEDLKAYIPTNAQSRAASLAQLRVLASLDKAVVTEMRQGLGELDGLAKKDQAWLDTLATAHPIHFLRPMRKVLEDSFEIILEWSVALLQAAITALDHPVKILALGRSVQAIDNPAIFQALSAWPMGKGPQGEALSRISLIKRQVGEPTFVHLLRGSPGLLSDLGTWPAKKIELYKEFLTILTGPVLKILKPLEEDHRLAVMDALTTRFGPKILSGAFQCKPGLSALQGVVNEIATMNQTAKQTPAKVRNLIAGSYFDDYLNRFCVTP